VPDNRLYYGDNLGVLRDHIASASVDLIYLDPPFNSKKEYNLLFKEASGRSAGAQVAAFEDTWRWDESAGRAYAEIVERAPANVASLVAAFCDALGHNDLTAYLVMMTVRLVELHRVLKDTGSLYLHCDPGASHYLKIILDSIFGNARFLGEIVWKRTSAHRSAATGASPRHRAVLL
jgi:site-specific DNA-methyltransferase (adenine-specific)